MAGTVATAILTQVPAGLAAATRDTTMTAGGDPFASTWAPWILLGFAVLAIAAIRVAFLYVHRWKRSARPKVVVPALPEDWPHL